MFHKATTLTGYSLHAIDGEIGKVKTSTSMTAAGRSVI